MGLTVMTLSKWTKLQEAHTHGRHPSVNGWSPGGVAAELKVTRQAVHSAIHSGLLDAIKVVMDDDRNRMVMFVVTPESLERYRAYRKARLSRSA